MKRRLIPTHELSDLADLGIKIERISHVNQYDPGAVHRHVYFEIFLFKEGGGTHLIDFEDHTIQDCSLYFITPGQVHLVDRTAMSSGYVLLFSAEFYYLNRENRDFLFNFPYFYLHTGSPKITVTLQEFEKCEELVAAMLKESEGPSKQKQKVLQSYLNIFLYKCQDLFLQYKETSTETRTSISVSLELFQQFRIEVEKKFRELKTLTQYANVLDTAPRSLHEACKKHGGYPPLKFIQNRVVLEAKRLLGHSGLHVSEIAYELGFTEPSQFSKFFKLHIGQSPNDWKNGRRN